MDKISSNIVRQVLDLAVQIQQIPAPTFEEAERAQFVQRLFQEEGLQDVFIDSVGNVYGCLPGQKVAPPLIITAHLDTVFPRETELNLRKTETVIYGPGIGDNSLGVAGLIAVIWLARQYSVSLPGDIWLVANVCEEGLGDLRGMRAVVQRWDAEVSAYIVLEGMALGQIYHRALGVKRYRITLNTPGGHSWVDHGRPSAIHHLAQLVTSLTSIPLPATPRTVLNVGKFQGGTSVNTIAQTAYIELDIRSEESSTLDWLVKQVLLKVERSKRDGVEVILEKIGDRPGGEISPEHWLVQLATRALRKQGLEPRLNIGSTDANIPLSMGLPAIGLGLTNGKGAHTTGEMIYARPLAKGLAQLLWLLPRCFKET